MWHEKVEDPICTLHGKKKERESTWIVNTTCLLQRKAVVKITTGSQALDELLGGKLFAPIWLNTECFFFIQKERASDSGYSFFVWTFEGGIETSAITEAFGEFR